MQLNLQSLQERDSSLKNAFLNHRLESISLFQINDTYLEPRPGKTWLIDGGVELITDDGAQSLRWDYDLEIYRAFTTPFNESYNGSEVYKIGSDEQLKKLCGKLITNVTLKWDWFEVPSTGREYFPQLIFVEFRDTTNIIIALVDYSFNHQDYSVESFHLDSEGEILVSTNIDPTRFKS